MPGTLSSIMDVMMSRMTCAGQFTSAAAASWQQGSSLPLSIMRTGTSANCRTPMCSVTQCCGMCDCVALTRCSISARLAGRKWQVLSRHSRGHAYPPTVWHNTAREMELHSTVMSWHAWPSFLLMFHTRGLARFHRDPAAGENSIA